MLADRLDVVDAGAHLRAIAEQPRCLEATDDLAGQRRAQAAPRLGGWCRPQARSALSLPRRPHPPTPCRPAPTPRCAPRAFSPPVLRLVLGGVRAQHVVGRPAFGCRDRLALLEVPVPLLVCHGHFLPLRRPSYRRPRTLSPMRYVIFGAGAIGGTIGGRLAEHGHDVVLVARGAHHDALRDRGLLLRTPSGPVQVQVPVTDDVSTLGLGAGDVVIVGTKSQDSEAAFDAIVGSVVARRGRRVRAERRRERAAGPAAVRQRARHGRDAPGLAHGTRASSTPTARPPRASSTSVASPPAWTTSTRPLSADLALVRASSRAPTRR